MTMVTMCADRKTLSTRRKSLVLLANTRKCDDVTINPGIYTGEGLHGSQLRARTCIRCGNIVTSSQQGITGWNKKEKGCDDGGSLSAHIVTHGGEA